MSLHKYSPNYQQAIAHLSQEFYDYGLKEKFPSINWVDPWSELCSVPELVDLYRKVEKKVELRIKLESMLHRYILDF